MNNALPSWNAGPTKSAILAFVESVTREGSPKFVPIPERIAVFDNDGTLWCEKPMPVELVFILQWLTAIAEKDESLRERQPWKSVYAKDYSWLANVITKHYQGDDSDVKILLGAILQAFAGMTMEHYQKSASDFLQHAPHPTLKLLLKECTYLPMIELLRYLEAHGFTTIIASGGDRDFMRTVTDEIYGIPPERVVGSSSALSYQEGGSGGSIAYLEKPDVFDDGPAKPVRIWSRTGRRPILSAGNSNGDIQMLQFSEQPGRPSLRLLLLHDDASREFDYVAGAERSLEIAKAQAWTIVSVRNDWSKVFR